MQAPMLAQQGAFTCSSSPSVFSRCKFTSPAASRKICITSIASHHHQHQEPVQLQQAESIDFSACTRRAGLAALSSLPFLSLQVQQAQAASTDVMPPSTSPIPEGQATAISEADVARLSASERQVYALNRRIQVQNRVPEEFPGFIRKGFDVLVVGEGYSTTPNGLIYKDFKVGDGPLPTDGQEVLFHYNGYNESGAIIDSSYRKGRPAQTRLGVAGLIPGFEEGIRGMRAGQQRRIIVPPALGPPVGPSTFFSAKQCEVFDVELLAVRSCTRRQLAMFSDVVCTDV